MLPFDCSYISLICVCMYVFVEHIIDNGQKNEFNSIESISIVVNKINLEKKNLDNFFFILKLYELLLLLNWIELNEKIRFKWQNDDDDSIIDKTIQNYNGLLLSFQIDHWIIIIFLDLFLVSMYVYRYSYCFIYSLTYLSNFFLIWCTKQFVFFFVFVKKPLQHVAWNGCKMDKHIQIYRKVNK